MGTIQHGCTLLEGEGSRQESHRLPATGPQLRPPSHEGKLHINWPTRYFCWINDCCRYSKKLYFLYFSFCVVTQDVPLISLANIFQNARLWEDALTVARMAVEIAPHFVVNHFTLANVYITMVQSSVFVTCVKPAPRQKVDIACLVFLDPQEEFEKAMRWYESTLKLQPEFAPAKDRLRTIQCYLLTKRDRRQPWNHWKQSDPRSTLQSCAHQIKNTQTHATLIWRPENLNVVKRWGIKIDIQLSLGPFFLFGVELPKELDLKRHRVQL